MAVLALWLAILTSRYPLPYTRPPARHRPY